MNKEKYGVWMLKKIIPAFLLFILFASSALAGEEYMADTDYEPLEFRGIKWQESLDNVRGMEELNREEDGIEITCSRKGEDLRFGRAELSSVEYVFINRKLSMVSVVVSGDKNQNALLSEAKSMFGQETIHAGDDYMWRFTNVMVMYSKEQNDQSVLFYKYIGFLNK
ncbi:MAG: hypothetical protein LBU26_06350 [Synergistaceae bacterium]|jgi:hypothetical protein|nr:hypothetical protein [Synergistaceae bacterium]